MTPEQDYRGLRDRLDAVESDLRDVKAGIERSRSFGTRVWDVAIKAMVPIVLVLAGVLIDAKVTNAVQDAELDRITSAIASMPAPWLREQMTALQAAQIRTTEVLDTKLDALTNRLSRLEGALGQHESTTPKGGK